MNIDVTETRSIQNIQNLKHKTKRDKFDVLKFCDLNIQILTDNDLKDFHEASECITDHDVKNIKSKLKRKLEKDISANLDCIVRVDLNDIISSSPSKTSG